MSAFCRKRQKRPQKHCAKGFQVLIQFKIFFDYRIFAAEFRSYFEHVRSLRFDDRPDYDYLKRMFRELFFRKGFRYDNIYDWDILALPVSERDKLTPEYTTGIDRIEGPLGPAEEATGLQHREGMVCVEHADATDCVW